MPTDDFQVITIFDSEKKLEMQLKRDKLIHKEPWRDKRIYSGI